MGTAYSTTGRLGLRVTLISKATSVEQKRDGYFGKHSMRKHQFRRASIVTTYCTWSAQNVTAGKLWRANVFLSHGRLVLRRLCGANGALSENVARLCRVNAKRRAKGGEPVQFGRHVGKQRSEPNCADVTVPSCYANLAALINESGARESIADCRST